MSNTRHAIQAYKTAFRYRSQRDREADVFRQTISALQSARTAGPIDQIRALADNRLLWITVTDLMRDPDNSLPTPLKASILSVGIAVLRQLDEESPDFDFLIAINENIAAGLTGSA